MTPLSSSDDGSRRTGRVMSLPSGIDIPTDRRPTVSESLKTPRTPADEAIEFFQSPKRDVEAHVHVYELLLDGKGGPNKDRIYIRLPPPVNPYVLRISLEAGTPASRKGVFKTNFPLDGGKFERTKILDRRLPDDPLKPIRLDIPISHAGAFLYWIEYETDDGRVKGREGYFNIDPVLRVNTRSPILSSELRFLSLEEGGGVVSKILKNLPLDGIVMLTVVSKWMGDLDAWEGHFEEATKRGYNMLHFTPLQQRGESHSPYSIADQMAYDSELFPKGWKGTKEDGVQKVSDVLHLARDRYGLLSLTDIVLNHTANNSEWLLDHPEAGYSPHNSPHLIPALEIDTAMINFSANLPAQGLPTRISSVADLDSIMDSFTKMMEGLNLWEYYILDVKREHETIREALKGNNIPTWTECQLLQCDAVEIAKILKHTGKIQGLSSFASRYCVHVDPLVAASIMKSAFPDLHDENAIADAWASVVDVLNVDLYAEAKQDLKAAIDGVCSRTKFTRLDPNGPQLGEISRRQPLVETYFTRLPHNERTAKHHPSSLSLANNGWIWDADPLLNFATLASKAYLRREVIVWGDCVKLRYGDNPEANPWLWQYMTNYVTTLAAQYDGFRIDNCHSTPLHVGMALLDAARVINPDIYVCAELFTGSEEMDLHFVSRLGINSLIREAYNAPNPKEFSRILYRFGINKPIGSMDVDCLTTIEDLPAPTGKGPTRTCAVTPLQGSRPHALLFDLTHDNESPSDKRSAEDALSTGALVAFCHCAVGSNKGFDDLYPKHLDIVNEHRKYAVQSTKDGRDVGIGRVKRLLNHLHTEMMVNGYREGHVHQENDYIVIHMINPSSTKGYLLVAHTAFSNGSKDRGCVAPIKLSRTKALFIFGASIEIEGNPTDDAVLRGFSAKLNELPPVVPLEHTKGSDTFSEIIVPDHFPPGTVMVFATHMPGLEPDLDVYLRQGADTAVANLDLIELNVMLYRADGEERDVTSGQIGAYYIPNMASLVYCGLEGWMHPLRHIMNHNDLGHPLASNLRDGTWAMEYIHTRLERQTTDFPGLAAPAAWLKSRFDKIQSTVPSFLRPKYFAVVVYEAYKACVQAAMEQFPDFISCGDLFTKALALTAVQLHGKVRSASLHPQLSTPCLAAGLPHFTAGWTRTWGRDVFISLRGLFLTTGNFTAARDHILAFCSTIKHGLIPNLLDSVRTPRYNSRDSPWWMLQNIQDYTMMVPNGTALLREQVKRRFPKNEHWVTWDDSLAYIDVSTVAEIVQEIVQRHALGISFREHNAGPNLDMQMRDQGFNIDVHVDWDSGILYGGSEWNCGTWMDKMGESEKAGTKGVPGTPRDGAPIEITGLLKSTLRWLSELSSKGVFPFRGVECSIQGEKRFVTYQEWSDRLQLSFEHHYYVPLDSLEDKRYSINPAIVNRRGIYKDVVGSGAGREWSDYQFRPNFAIAMTVAPELFDKEHALGALKLADVYLRGPLGMKTLDAADNQYRPDYDNSNDSSDPAIAKGRNYHQGPEWGWPLGYFLRAYLHFEMVADVKNEAQKIVIIHNLISKLFDCRRHILQDPWAGLPELTNRSGAFCRDSCATQAWSSGTLLDFLDDIRRYNESILKN